MFDQRKFLERIDRSSLPASHDLLGEPENFLWFRIAGNDQSRVVGHVITSLDGPHLIERGGRNRFARSLRILSRRVFVEKFLLHSYIQITERVGFAAIDLANHDAFFFFEFCLVKRGKADRIVYVAYCGRQIRACRGEVVIDDLLASCAVIDTHFIRIFQV